VSSSPYQTTGTTEEAFERTVRAWRRLQERLCTHRERFPWGTAFLDLDHPTRYDSNHLWLDGPATGASAEAIAGEADRILGGAGLLHRKIIVVREAEGVRLGLGLGERGYQVARDVTMALQAEPDADVDTSAVEVVDFATARPAIETANAREPYGTSDEVVRQLTDYKGKLEREIGCRFYVARADGRIAAFCELYVIDGIAQVEDVNTLEEFRGRGFAKAIVTAAARDARDEGCDLVFLFADRDDWPQQMYAKLGFRPLGHSTEFTLELPPA
jgi:ribosomal protein S18 acetylase RimI-like enzyme